MQIQPLPQAQDRLFLPQVTLVAVDTRAPALALQSLMRSMARVRFARVVLFTHAWAQAPVMSDVTPNVAPDITPDVDLVDCGPIHSGEDYSRFVLRQLPAHIHTSHVLVTQWDGFVIDASAWRPEFLDYDYIGAVWPDQAPGAEVGNGGFSLRSRRLLDAGMDGGVVQLHPEDVALCRTYRELLHRQHGVRLAPAALARRFAFENERATSATFGFHGPYNLPLVMDPTSLAPWLEALPPEFFRSRDARRLARALLSQSMPLLAQRLVQRRMAAGRTDINTRLLGALARAQGLFSASGRP